MRFLAFLVFLITFLGMGTIKEEVLALVDLWHVESWERLRFGVMIFLIYPALVTTPVFLPEPVASELV